MHLLIVSDTAKEYHHDIFEALNNKLYPFEGKIRQGYNRPHLSEIKLYNIRVKKEVAPLLLRDMAVINPTSMLTHKSSNKIMNIFTRKSRFKAWLIITAVNLIRKLGGMVDVESDKGLRDNPWKQWCYNWFIGGYRDDRFDRGFGEEL